MKFEKNNLVAIVICMVFFLGYEYYLNTKYPNRHKRPKPAVTTTNTDISQKTVLRSTDEAATKQEGNTPQKASSAQEQKVVLLSAEDLTIESDTSIYRFDQTTGGIQGVTLKSYFTDPSQTKRVEALSGPLTLQALVEKNDNFDGAYAAERPSSNSIKFSRKKDFWELSHTISVDENDHGLELDFEWTNTSEKPQNLNSIFLISDVVDLSKNESSGLLSPPGSAFNRTQYVMRKNGETTRFDAEEECKKESNSISADRNSTIEFYGANDQYFARVFLPQSPKLSYEVTRESKSQLNSPCRVRTLAALDHGQVNPGESVKMHLKGWIGPKITDELSKYDSKLEETVDFGFFSSISKILLYLLRVSHDLVGNWGLAIILVTMLIKILFFPLQNQASVSMHKQKILQPEMNRIKEQFQNDPQRQSQEMMKFMAKHKINPLKRVPSNSTHNSSIFCFLASFDCRHRT